MGDNGAIVDKDFAEDKHLALGDVFSLRGAERRARCPLRVVGIYKPPPFYPILGTVSIPEGDLRQALRAAAEPVHVRERRQSQ